MYIYIYYGGVIQTTVFLFCLVVYKLHGFMFPISQPNLFPWPLLYNWLTKGSSEISFIGFCVSAPNIPSHVWHRKLTRLARNAANLGALSILVGQAEEVGQGNSDSKRTSVDGQNPAPLGMPETLFFYGPGANKWFSGIVGGAGFFPHIMNPFYRCTEEFNTPNTN